MSGKRRVVRAAVVRAADRRAPTADRRRAKVRLKVSLMARPRGVASRARIVNSVASGKAPRHAARTSPPANVSPAMPRRASKANRLRRRRLRGTAPDVVVGVAAAEAVGRGRKVRPSREGRRNHNNRGRSGSVGHVRQSRHANVPLGSRVIPARRKAQRQPAEMVRRGRAVEAAVSGAVSVAGAVAAAVARAARPLAVAGRF